MILSVITDRVTRMFLRLRGLHQQIQRPAGLMRTVAEGLEHQTRVRIHFEKRSPDGKAWAPWSLRYARTRKASTHSLLKDTWSMVDDDLDHTSTATTATVFNTAPYAGVHQDGSVFGPMRAGRGRIPARPYLGLSTANVRDLESWLGPAIEQLVQESIGGGIAS